MSVVVFLEDPDNAELRRAFASDYFSVRCFSGARGFYERALSQLADRTEMLPVILCSKMATARCSPQTMVECVKGLLREEARVAYLHKHSCNCLKIRTTAHAEIFRMEPNPSTIAVLLSPESAHSVAGKMRKGLPFPKALLSVARGGVVHGVFPNIVHFDLHRRECEQDLVNTSECGALDLGERVEEGNSFMWICIYNLVFALALLVLILRYAVMKDI